MSKLLWILTLLVATSATTEDERGDSERFQNAIAKCAKDFSIREDEKEAHATRGPTSSRAKCYMSCIGETLNLVDEEGEPDVGRIAKMAGMKYDEKVDRDNYLAYLNKCKGGGAQWAQSGSKKTSYCFTEILFIAFILLFLERKLY